MLTKAPASITTQATKAVKEFPTELMIKGIIYGNKQYAKLVKELGKGNVAKPRLIPLNGKGDINGNRTDVDALLAMSQS